MMRMVEEPHHSRLKLAFATVLDLHGIANGGVAHCVVVVIIASGEAYGE